MKLYTASFAPNPRRVHIYLEEKGIELERVYLDMRGGEHRAASFLEKNPLGLLPVLELDDGRLLSESLAICEYLEELHPEPALLGGDAWQRARTREATRRAELGLLFGAALAFQHSNPFFAGRFPQHVEVAEVGRRRFLEHLEVLDTVLAARRWLAGEDFTIADITALCAIDFGTVCGCSVPSSLAQVTSWLERVRQRPSCQLRRK